MRAAAGLSTTVYQDASRQHRGYAAHNRKIVHLGVELDGETNRRDVGDLGIQDLHRLIELQVITEEFTRMVA